MHDLRAEAEAYLRAFEATWTRSDRGSREDLAELLVARGLPCYEVLLEIEQRVGGWSVPDPSGDTVFGTFQLLRDQLPEARPGYARHRWNDEPLVWVGATSSSVLYATSAGEILEVDFYSGHEVLVAEDIEGWMARAHVPVLDDELGLGAIGSAAGRFGAQLATALGLAPDPNYTCHYFGRWVGPDHAVFEAVYPYDGNAATTVAAVSEERLQRALGLIAPRSR